MNKTNIFFCNTWEQDKLSEIIVSIPFKQYLMNPETSGEFPVIQQGYIPIVGYADGNPFIDYNNTVLFGDHTLSLYKPTEPYFVATDGLRIISSINNMDQNYMFSLLEKNMPISEGYKRYFGILKELEVGYTKSKKEQSKIGNLLNNIDQLITLPQRK